MIDAHISTRDSLDRLSLESRSVRAGGAIVRFGGAPEPEAGRWPAWKSALFVVVFCGAFWAGVAYLVSRLFS